MPGILRWEDPAPRSPASDDYEPIAAGLQNKPGVWAVIAENPDTPEGKRASARMFNAVKHGYKGFRRVEDGTYRATTRTVTNGDGTKVILVHAMFVSSR
ncbi:hypothetical protein [Nonomuraea sp. NPDC049784]|uniref:hypothetical protein n=1 Tax=Nonomuraea sp. NPDC049784 TaxID=3154361 RepID=UPI0033FA8664